MEIFGPVPSRRLGQSIGVNHIPPKICTYACRYCQLGQAIRMQTNREVFFEPADIVAAVKKRLDISEHVDYVTLVPDGEPTLDARLGELILELKGLNVPVAVITNSSLLWDQQVRSELLPADWVSVKVDAASEDVWKKVDRPHKNLNFNQVQQGVFEFAKAYKGHLMTETMLIDGYNDSKLEIDLIADLLAEINPEISYISIPTRPPAENQIHAANETSLSIAYASFSKKVKRVELLIGYEGNEFAFTGNSEADILSITAVHPMRQDAVDTLLKNNNADMSVVDKLIQQKQLLKIEYQNEVFYLRKLKA
jgi:wyosine [tRNA(Phe)-imidazoG37] synthetase (radical SAM superfamily)